MRWWRLAGNPSVARAGGVWAVLKQARLAYRLLRDQRVPALAKLVVPAALFYLISPVDVAPDIFPLLGQLDDLGVVLLAVAAFIKLCPQHLVEEHEAALDGRAPRTSGTGATRDPLGEEPIDARYRWVDERPRR